MLRYHSFYSHYELNQQATIIQGYVRSWMQKYQNAFFTSNDFFQLGFSVP